MPPPGRRRAQPMSLLACLLLTLLFFSPAVLAQNAALGIDVGTEYIKAALVKPGIPLDIVLTKDSKRKETSAIAFKSIKHGLQADDQLPERLYGGDALSLAPRFPGDVYPNLKHLLGAGQDSRVDAVETYRARYPALGLFSHAENNTLAFKSQSFPPTHPSFSVEELMSMELRSIRDNAEAAASSTVTSAVITIPPFFSADERRAIELSAELAGLRVIGLVSDGMAVGLNYATTRTFGNVDEGEKPEHHLVYDMGAGSTTATVLRMRGKRVKDVGKFNKTVQEVTALGVGWDRTLGGDALNDLIVGDMVEKFIATSEAKKANIEASTIRNHGRTMAKFWREAERLRQVLSANTASSGFFESLYDDIDFRYKLSRSEFEDMTADFGLRVPQPLRDALQSAGLQYEDLTSVIMHGGAVRTPLVQNSLETFTRGGPPLKSNVNADEAAVFGAAFKAAGLSPSFKVKEIKDNDLATYPVILHWETGLRDKERSQQIFVPTSQAGPAKQMPFRKFEDFSFSFGQKLPLVEIERPVLDVKATNLTASVAKLMNDHGCIKENITTVISVRIDPANGLPEVSRGTVTCEAWDTEKKGMMDGMKDMFGFGKKDQQPLNEGEDEEVIEPLPETSSTATSSPAGSSSSSSAKSATSSAKGKESKDPVKKTITINIKFESTKTGLLQPRGDTLQRIKDGLSLFDKSDKGRRLREELFNGLEAYTYRVRDMLNDAGFKGVTTETQRSEVEKMLGSTSEWLHGEGSSAGMDAIKERLQGLRGLVDPVTKRKEEIAKRPKAVEKLQDALGIAGLLKESISSTVSSAAEAASSSAAQASSSAAEAAASVSEAATSATADVGGAASSVTEAIGEAASSATEGAADAASSVTESVGDAASSASEAASEASQDPSAAYSSIMAQISAFSNSNLYTDSDVTRLEDAIGSAKGWLEEKLKAQGALSESDEPAFLSTEIEERTTQLRKLTDELNRKKKNYQSSRSSSSKKASKTKAKSSASTTTSTSTSTSTSSVPASETETQKHDEL